MDKINGTNISSVIASLKPVKNTRNWIEVDAPSNLPNTITARAWLHYQGFFVISAVESVSGEMGGDRAEYHLSCSKTTGYEVFRCDSNEAKQILDDFGFDGAEEDNHAPFGKARNFWRPVNENMIGSECGCKAQESAIKEDKGDYIWRPV